MSSSVDQIKSKIDIVTLVSSYIQLERAGTNFKGRCPFHNERTPSFFVSPDRNSYYCFGCHAKGDIFTFVQEFEGVDFIGALKMLALRAGIELDTFDRKDKTETEIQYGVLEQANFFYQKKFTETPEAQKYMEHRGVTPDTLRDFKVGYAPHEWRSLYDFLLSKGVTPAQMYAVGLIKRKEGTTDTYYDTFRGRIMFPIADSTGRVVGFSGRILVADDKSPKYLNSPETELFNKSEILFGLDLAKKDIRIKNYSVLVEGQMDLVMMHQVGISNTVASSGTALTSDHLVKLRRLSNRIIMAFDGDSAGFAASDRSARLALSLGMELKVVTLPTGKDPADLALENPHDLKERLAHAKHIIDFYTDSLIEQGHDSRELGNEVRIHVLPYVALLTSSIERAHFIKSIAQKLFIKEEALWEDLKHVSASTPSPVSQKQSSVEKTNRIDSIEKKVIGIIMWQKESSPPAFNVVDYEKRARDILKDRYETLVTVFEKGKEALLFEIESYYNNTTHLLHEAEELMNGLEEEYLKRELNEMMVQLQKAEQQRDSALVLKYLEECQRISQKINIIKQIKNEYEKK